MVFIDLNCDGGESEARISDGFQEKLLNFVSSVNITCGAHAGDRATIEATVRMALQKNLAIGALVSYPDRLGHGRDRHNLTGDDVSQTVFNQLKELSQICKSLNAEITHVRPHAGLYRDVTYDTALAESLSKGIAQFSEKILTVGLANSKMLGFFESIGFKVAGEGFPDRVYEANGNLRLIDLPGALFSDVKEAVAQAIDIVTNQFVKTSDGELHTVQSKTLHIRSEKENAMEKASAIHSALKLENVTIKNLL